MNQQLNITTETHTHKKKSFFHNSLLQDNTKANYTHIINGGNVYFFHSLYSTRLIAIGARRKLLMYKQLRLLFLCNKA